MLVEKEIKDIYIAEHTYLTSTQLWALSSMQSAEDELNSHPSQYYDFYVNNWTIENWDTWFVVHPGEGAWQISLYTWYFEYDATTQTWTGSELA